MQFILFNEKEKQQYSNEIYEITRICDKDFVPPLSARSSTLQKNFSKVSDGGSIDEYFVQMMEQKVLGVIEDGVLLGFVSFKENYCDGTIDENTVPNIYVSTVMLSPQARGRRLTACAYEHLFNSVYKDYNVYTRTWSTNGAHIRILEKFGFRELKRIKDDRGENIDTVYFEKLRK